MAKILIIKAHPATDSFCHALADAYADGAKTAGQNVRSLALNTLPLTDFLFANHRRPNDLLPELREAQTLIAQADTLVFAYPLWWAGPPALLKLFFELVFTSGFAYRYLPATGFIPRWKKHLSGKKARLITTMDSPLWYYRWLLRDPNGKMMRANLKFCGVSPVTTHYFGSIKLSSPEKKAHWLKQAFALGLREK